MKILHHKPAPTLPDLVSRYRERTSGGIHVDRYNQMVHTYHSTAIEGSSLTLPETQTLLEKGLPAGGKPLDHHLMAIDYQRAQEMTLELARQREPLNRATLQRIGATVMRQTGGPASTILGTFDSSQGDFRTVGAVTDSPLFVDAKKVPTAVDRLLKEINSAVTEAKTMRQVYDLSFQAHYQLLAIHPFGDGNGRTSRLLMNYVQQYHKLPLSLVYAQDYTAYTAALQQTRKQESLVPMNQFMYGQLIRFLTEEISPSLDGPGIVSRLSH